ncbi:MAG: ABC transporter permease [Firmicutes bacterium]|nr:ABC transporter permease [Bacillota bacterium]
MSYLAKIAFKNLFRSKLRTIVSIAAIAFGVMIVVFARGILVGMVDAVYADHVQYDSGHIKIVDAEYQKRERLLTLNYPVDGLAGQGLEQMIAALPALDRVELVVPRLKFGAMVSTGDKLISMSGWGVNPETEIAITDIEDYLAEGRMVTPGRQEVVMGTALLAKIDRKVGDKVTIVFNTAYGSLRGVTFDIVGRIESGLKLLNEMVFYLPLDQAQRLLEMEDQVTELLLVTADPKLVPQVLPEVKALLAKAGEDGRYLALSYRETSDLIPLMDLSEVIFGYVYLFLVTLSCIVVVNTMIMIIRERTREIGMMAALGLEAKHILQLFVIEGAFLGIAGSLAGAVLGHLITVYLGKTGFDYGQALSGMDTGVLFDTMFYPVASTANAIFAFVLGVAVVTLACVFPARRAARLQPTEAMREGGQ